MTKLCGSMSQETSSTAATKEPPPSNRFETLSTRIIDHPWLRTPPFSLSPLQQEIAEAVGFCCEAGRQHDRRRVLLDNARTGDAPSRPECRPLIDRAIRRSRRIP